MNRSRRPSSQMVAIVHALVAGGAAWRHGYDLMRETGLSSGTLYPLLMRMTERGYVEAEWQPPAKAGRPARHAYRLTAAGLALARTMPATDEDASHPGAAVPA